jgi:hypothetical protein
VKKNFTHAKVSHFFSAVQSGIDWRTTVVRNEGWLRVAPKLSASSTTWTTLPSGRRIGSQATAVRRVPRQQFIVTREASEQAFGSGETTVMLLQKFQISGGFCTDARAVAGLGITCMTERARQLDAGLEIESRPASGTTVRFSLPVQS